MHWERRKEGSKPPISTRVSLIKIAIIITMVVEEVSKHQLGRAC